MARPGYQQKKGRGCFFYGCLTIIGLAFFAVIGVFMAYRMSVQWAVNQYTTTTPIELPVTKATAELHEATAKKLKEFGAAVKANTGPQQLVLTADEINSMVQFDPSLAAVKGKVYLDIQGDQLEGQLNFPLEVIGSSIPLSGASLTGRYITGTAKLTVNMRNEMPNITFLSATVNGKDVPADLVKGFNNGFQESYEKEYRKQDPEVQETMAKIESVIVKDGKLVIQTKPVEKQP